MAMTAELYRHFDADGQLLYVGVSYGSIARLQQHRGNADWVKRIKRMEVQRFSSREDALKAEADAIRAEKPLHNLPLGRPPIFTPSPEHDAEIKAAWHDEDRTITGVMRVAKRLGYSPELHHLKHRYGNRFKKDNEEPRGG